MLVTDHPTCPLGLRIYRQVPRPDPAAMERLREAGIGDISDAMRGMGVPDPDIRFVGAGGGRIFGPAVTVDLAPGDGMMVRAAVDVARPGDVIVVNAHGVRERAVLGGSVGMHMTRRGVAGVVVDGAVRDVCEFEALGLPVMARAVSPRSGSTGSGYGEVNIPVACGGVVVHPGDLVVGDREGIVIVPRLWVGAVAALIGLTDHAPYNPAQLRQKLADLAPGAPVAGMARVEAAMRGGGLVVDDVWTADAAPGG